MPGVIAVLAAADLPIASTDSDRTAEPLAREEVVFSDSRRVVVAESEAAAEDGAEAVIVEYEALDAVLDVEQAMAPGAALARRVEEAGEGGDLESIHAGVDEGREADEDERLSANVVGQVNRGAGDVAAWRRATPSSGRSGRRGLPGVPRATGVHGLARAGREHSWCRRALRGRSSRGGARAGVRSPAGADQGRRGAARRRLRRQVRARRAARCRRRLVLRRPVRLVLTRAEDFQATNPASAQVTHLRIGGRKDGTLTGIEARMVVDRGSNAGWGVEGITSLLVAGPYRWEAHDLRGYGVQTNRFTFGAYRGPGAPTAAFALESLLDELAVELGVDPLELRLKNAVVQGDVGVSGSAFPVIGAVEVLERCASIRLAGAQLAPRGRGVGVAAGYWPGGTEPAAAVCRVDKDGTMTVVTSAVDMSGVSTGFAAIAAAAFGLPPEKVRVVSRRHGQRPVRRSERRLEGHLHGGCRGPARRGRRARSSGSGVEELEIAPGDLEVVDGVVRAVGAPDRSITVEEIAGKALRFGRYEPIEGHGAPRRFAVRPRSAPTSPMLG